MAGDTNVMEMTDLSAGRPAWKRRGALRLVSQKGHVFRAAGDAVVTGATDDLQDRDARLKTPQQRVGVPPRNLDVVLGGDDRRRRRTTSAATNG